jgi:deoxyribose-phosphate aldolase
MDNNKILRMSPAELANMIDQTLLKQYVSNEEFKKLCLESKEFGFKMVAINPAVTKLCKEYLKGSKVLIGAAIGFPLGQNSIETKVFETKNAIENGADEIDYVINIVELKNRNLSYIEKEMKQIVEVCKNNKVTSKVIFENCYLTEEEKTILCTMALSVGPDFIKTSTGFGEWGAKVEDVRLMKKLVGNKIKVKAAGGIRDLATMLDMINAGAERIGTSGGVKIIEEYRQMLSK